MAKCSWIREVEKWFDGEAADAQAVERHLASCAACAAHVAQLRAVHQGVEAVAVRETIAEPQVPAFLDGIRERVEQPGGGRRGFWALASATAAALLIASVVFLGVTGGPSEVLATEIESYSTEIAGATVTSYVSEDGTATVCVSLPKEEAQ